jgi:hypothetical protein
MATRKPNLGELDRAILHEADETIEIVAYFGPANDRRKGRSRRVEIPAARFFGHGYGAPISGDQLVQLINKLRRPVPVPNERAILRLPPQ